MFTTKAFVLPHLRMVIAGTGAGRFLGKWFIRLNDRIAVKDIDNLNYHAPLTLSKRPVLPWEKMAIAVCAAILRSARAGRW
jgi:hypothetical protein